MNDNSEVGAAEFSRVVQPESVPPTGLELTIEANPREREALANRIGLLSLDELRATLQLHHATDNTMIDVGGSLNAKVTQQCVVTLEPVQNSIKDEPVVGLFAPPHLVRKDAKTDELDSVVDDEPEPYGPDGGIDLGELVAQHLAMVIDPYPRKPGVEFAGFTAETPGKGSPFAKLLELGKKQDK